ncbi:MAG TPA: NADH-quinone oxidoreductase subunit I [Planctomycetes bacterium]|nr:NADH-quinone oxidoreductase subunit I [Planctomycetota bacterium]
MSTMNAYFGKIREVSRSIIIGMGLTWRYLVNPKEIVTVQYGSKKYGPQKNYLPPRHRGIHYLETEKCIQCEICAKACPVDCIEMEGTRDGDLEGGWQGDKVQISRFVIDLNKCIFCNLCCEPCPKSCIHMGQEFDLAAYTRSHGVKNLLTDKPWSQADAEAEAWRRDEMKRLAEEKKKKKAAEKAARDAAKKAAAEKKKPDGDDTKKS